MQLVLMFKGAFEAWCIVSNVVAIMLLSCCCHVVCMWVETRHLMYLRPRFRKLNRSYLMQTNVLTLSDLILIQTEYLIVYKTTRVCKPLRVFQSHFHIYI